MAGGSVICEGCAAPVERTGSRGPAPRYCPGCKADRKRARQRKPADERVFRVLSLGAGQQSSALLLMSIAGVLPRLDLVVFADTRWERQATYDTVAELERRAAEAGIRFERVSAGALRDEALGDFVPMPVYGRHEGRDVVMRQSCTMNYKIRPTRRLVRELAGPLHGLKVEMWLGISFEETYRMKPSPVAYIEHVYPLIDMRWTRADCVRFLVEHGMPEVRRSSCIACPFKGTGEWRAMAREAPAEWADAVEFDAELRSRPDPLFVHHSRRPLPLVLEAPEQGDLFGSECEGYCGV